MPAAVVQLDLEALPARVAVAPRYSQAFVVVRYRGRPRAHFWIPVHAGEMDNAAFAEALHTEFTSTGKWWLLEDYLGPDPVISAPDATVAICTRERPDDLQRTLAAVAALDPPAREILVVDNAPVSQRTRAVVEKFPAVRYVCEPIAGLDRARNRAMREARCDVVAFTDDDAAPEPPWLAFLLQPFADRRVRCTTGLTLPAELETDAQEWFERYSPFGKGFGRRIFDGARDDQLAVGRVGAGANMALRRSVIDELGGFDEALDAGTPSRSGGDHEMFGRILLAGFRIVYEPAAVSWHRHRRTMPELKAAVGGYGVGVYAMWTRRLLHDREPGVLRQALSWLKHGQLPALWRVVRRRPDAVPFDLIASELAGCASGPLNYLRARRAVRRA